jgi:hypothetical protein
MSRSYPIWNEIKSCIYSAGKSYGVKDHNEVTVKVGTSAKNSHTFITHCVTRKVDGDYTIFRFSIDGVIVKTAWLHHKKDSALLFEDPTKDNGEGE